jgi:hypothetical protein
MLQIVTREPADYAASLPQQSGTATLLVGTPDVAVPVAKILEFARWPGAPAELKELAEGILDELEAEEELEDMVSARSEDTGLPNAIKIIPGNLRHGPRIKVAIDPPDRFSDRGVSVYVSFGEAPGSFGKASGVLPDALLRQVCEFIEMNRADLFAFDRDPDQGGISGAEVVRRLRKVTAR